MEVNKKEVCPELGVAIILIVIMRKKGRGRGKEKNGEVRMNIEN